ncbi:MAG: 2-oxoisovalerate dehydrogenase [Isosphaeraceae bacterium]
MSELIFIVEKAPEGGFTARALGASIFTEADTWVELQAQVRDAVRCHFEEGQRATVVRLHHARRA